MRIIFVLIFPAIFLSKCGNAEFKEKESILPNVVIILADDQGWGDLSYNGNDDIRTPNIDYLAHNGASFSNFFVQPVCSPTRAELLTGRYHPRSGVYSTSAGGERMDLDEQTIADVFQEAGYRTGAFGKWHNGSQYPYHPNGRGFQHFYGFTSGHWGNYFDPLLESNGELLKGKGFIIDDLTDKAMEYMSKPSNKPFFVYIPYNVPHSPMQVPEKWWERFANRDLNFKFEKATDAKHAQAALAMVENMDWNIGRINDFLVESQLDENTIVIYMTDNGPNGNRWNGGMRGIKGSTDDGGTRSPMFIKWPKKIRRGIQVGQLSGIIDILPTLHSLCGLNNEFTKPLDGMDLSAHLLESENNPYPTDRLIYNYWRGKTSVRSQNYRLDAENRLYNMSMDPKQKTDLSTMDIQKYEELLSAKKSWNLNVLAELSGEDHRPIPIGDNGFDIYHLPIRDAQGHGNIERSNKYPNDSYFSNWTSLSDSITWEIEVSEDGNFEIDLLHTVGKNEIGSIIEVRNGTASIEHTIDQAFDQSLIGMADDRVMRIESYVQEWGVTTLGVLPFKKGDQQLALKATAIATDEVADIRMLLLRRKKDL